MIFLILSIVASSLIYICFNIIKQKEAHNFSTILVNYWVAGITGIVVAYVMAPETSITLDLLVFAGILGFVFITIFLVMANTTQTFGIGTASVASKMSLVIPVVIGLTFFDESLSTLKLIGLITALISVYLVSYKKDRTKSNKWWLPLILFLGSGFIDTLLNKGQMLFHQSGLSYWLIPLIFIFAGIYGTAYGLGTKKLKIRPIEFKLGFLLGVINFGSILFLLLTLAQPSFESSSIFPINNVGIVALSAILGFVIYQEKVTVYKITGVLLAIASTLLIGFN
jgi:drug/metabolite transporter (DMT)-like permease